MLSILNLKFRPSRLIQAVLLLITIAIFAIVGWWFLVGREAQENQAAEVKERVEENPEACVEEIDESTLVAAQTAMKIFPREVSEEEIESQLELGYITLCQCEDLYEILDSAKPNGVKPKEETCLAAR